MEAMDPLNRNNAALPNCGFNQIWEADIADFLEQEVDDFVIL